MTRLIRKRNVPLGWPDNLRRANRGIVLAAVCLGLLLASSARSQNLVNTGHIFNTGTLRLHNQVTGLADSLQGLVELYGADQPVPATYFKKLNLLGSGTKTALGNVGFGDTVTIASGVTFQIPPGSTASLDSSGGRLVENGALLGAIRKSANLAGATTASDFGGIGASLQWAGIAPGLTTVTRVSGTSVAVNGKQSIRRWLDIHVPVDTTYNATLTFNYSPAEAAGFNTSTLELWRSPDNGATWRRQHVTRGTNQIVRSGIRAFGRWSAADDLNPLGLTKYEYDADTLGLFAGDNQLRPVHSTVSPYVVQVFDAYQQSVSGATVVFSIDSIPAGATGQALTSGTATSDQNGYASTQLQLGNKTGRYVVDAQVQGVAGATVKFVTVARSLAQVLASVTGNAQVDSVTTLIQPFKVQTKDSLGNFVPGVDVRFRIVSAPTGAIGHVLSDTALTSDSLGNAQTVLKLGTKIGPYKVVASSPDIPSVTDTFAVVATHGFAAKMLLASGDAQADTILKAIQPLSIQINDAYDNPDSNASVAYSITQTPAGATGQGLSSTSIKTDAGGKTAVILTLGNKVGSYKVTALSANIPSASQVFTLNALAAAPSSMDSVKGGGQTKPILAFLDTAFVVRIVDVGGNPKPGIPVNFAVTAKPSGTSSDSLSKSVDTTNALGQASTVLRTGSKVGVYTVTATSAQVAGKTRVFTANAVAGTAALASKVSGDGQNGNIGDMLNPYVVTVTDIGGNPVPNVMVEFATTSVPSGAMGYKLSKQVDTTNVLGQAFTVLTMGSKSGTYKVVATVGNLPGAIFTSTAKFVLADANNDGSVDIADLTQLIDVILQKDTLRGYDFARADINGDGVIDIRDAELLANRLIENNWGSADSLIQAVLLGNSVRPQIPTLAAARVSTPVSMNAAGQLEITNIGLRLDLTNDAPVKGVELVLVLQKPMNVNRADLIFDRAKQMTVQAASSGDTVRVIAYNLKNQPIDTGSGAIFRIPLVLADSGQIVSKQVILSVANNQSSSLAAGAIGVIKPTYPSDFALLQNYPNPFNPSTTIEYDVPEIDGKVAHVAIQIFNILGEKVKTIDRSDRDAGHYKITWDGTDERGARVATGVYIYRLLSGSHAVAKKMVMIK